MSGLTQAERELLLCDCHSLNTDDSCPMHDDRPDLWVDKPASEIEAAVEQIITARLNEYKARAVAAIEATSVDPERVRPLADDAETGTDFANDWQWAAQIIRDLT